MNDEFAQTLDFFGQLKLLYCGIQATKSDSLGDTRNGQDNFPVIMTGVLCKRWNSQVDSTSQTYTYSAIHTTPHDDN